MIALKTLIFSILVPGTVAGIIPWLLLQGSGNLVLRIPSIWMIGLFPLLLGVGLYLWCAGAFTFIGKGTPAPIDAPKVLVVQGLYRWVRNPMYIAVVSVVMCEAILLLWGVFHMFVVFVAEPLLRSQFGASYETYFRTVPRWLPRLPRPPHP